MKFLDLLNEEKYNSEVIKKRLEKRARVFYKAFQSRTIGKKGGYHFRYELSDEKIVEPRPDPDMYTLGMSIILPHHIVIYSLNEYTNHKSVHAMFSTVKFIFWEERIDLIIKERHKLIFVPYEPENEENINENNDFDRENKRLQKRARLIYDVLKKKKYKNNEINFTWELSDNPTISRDEMSTEILPPIITPTYLKVTPNNSFTHQLSEMNYYQIIKNIFRKYNINLFLYPNRIYIDVKKSNNPDYKQSDVMEKKEGSNSFEREKYRVIKKSLIIYGIFRKRRWDKNGYDFSWEFSDDAEIKYQHSNNESSAVIYPKYLKLKLHSKMAREEWERGLLRKDYFFNAIQNYFTPYNIKIFLNFKDIHVVNDEEKPDEINENVESERSDKSLYKKVNNVYKLLKKGNHVKNDMWEIGSFKWELSDEKRVVITKPNDKKIPLIQPIYINVTVNNKSRFQAVTKRFQAAWEYHMKRDVYKYLEHQFKKFDILFGVYDTNNNIRIITEQ